MGDYNGIQMMDAFLHKKRQQDPLRIVDWLFGPGVNQNSFSFRRFDERR